MKRKRLKIFIAGSIAVSALVFGIRAGERIESPLFERSGLGLVAVMVVHGLALAPTRRRLPGEPSRWLRRQALPRVTFAAMVLLAGAGGWKIGEVSGQRAFAECLASGEEVRLEIAAYQEETGLLPESLDRVGMGHVGSRCLNGSLLEYRPEGATYTLSFGDRFVEHRATESAPFVAHE